MSEPKAIESSTPRPLHPPDQTVVDSLLSAKTDDDIDRVFDVLFDALSPGPKGDSTSARELLAWMTRSENLAALHYELLLSTLRLTLRGRDALAEWRDLRDATKVRLETDGLDVNVLLWGLLD